MRRDPTAFRERFKKWKETGEYEIPKYYLGTEGDNIEELIKKRLESKSDATTVQRQESVLPIKRDFIAEALRKHAAEAIGPDTRSSYLQKQSHAAKLYANQLYLKAKEDAKRAEGMEQMMKTISPSTYIEAATGKDLGTVGRLATDAAVFGLPNMLKYGVSKALTTPILGKWVYKIPENANMAYRIMGPLERDWLLQGNELSTRATNALTKAEEAAARATAPKVGKFTLFKAGSEHGGRKQFAKGQLWKGNTTTHGEHQVLAIPGENLPWISGRHYRGPRGHGFLVGDISFEEAPFGSHIDLQANKEGFTGINPSSIEGSMIYSPMSLFGNKLGYRIHNLYKPSKIQFSAQPIQNSSSEVINPYKLGSDFETDTKELFNRMKSFQIRQSLAQTKTPEINLADEFGIRDLSRDVIHHEGMPNFVEDVFRYQVLPRTNIRPIDHDSVILRLSKYGYNTTDDYTWAKYVNDNTAGYLDNNTYGIAIRDGYLDYAAPHEFRHRMQRLIQDRPSLMIDRKGYLDRAYNDDFVNLPKNVPESDSLYGYTLMEDEKATTNLDARRWAFENFSDNPNIGKASLKEQNEFLDNLTDDLIIVAVAKGNSYGRKYIDFLERTYDLLNNPRLDAMYANNFRNAMKYYGMFGAPIGIGYGMYNKYAE